MIPVLFDTVINPTSILVVLAWFAVIVALLIQAARTIDWKGETVYSMPLIWLVRRLWK